MNKNWLYRVLALALVAMLALPMFALAEDVLADQAEAPAAAGSIAIGGEEDAISKLAISDQEVNVFLDSSTVTYVGLQKGQYLSIIVWNEIPGTEITFSSNKSGVASVDSQGNVFGVDQGTATIKLSGELTTPKGKVKKVTRKVIVAVYDPYLPTDSTIVVDDPADTLDEIKKKYPTLTEAQAKELAAAALILTDLDGSTQNVIPGQQLLVVGGTSTATWKLYNGLLNATPALINKEYAEEGRGITWTTSNRKVVSLDPGTDKSGLAYVVPTFRKPGKAKVTVTSAKVSGNKTTKATVTFNVEKNKATITTKAEQKELLKVAKAAKVLIVGIQDIEVKDIDNVVVNLFFANGSEYTASGLNNFQCEIGAGMVSKYVLGVPVEWEIDEFLDYNPPTTTAPAMFSVSAKIKKNALTTAKVTFNNVWSYADPTDPEIVVERIVGDVAQPMSAFPFWNAIITNLYWDKAPFIDTFTSKKDAMLTELGVLALATAVPSTPTYNGYTVYPWPEMAA